MLKRAFLIAGALVATSGITPHIRAAEETEAWNLSVVIERGRLETPLKFDLSFHEKLIDFRVRRYPVITKDPDKPEVDIAFQLGASEQTQKAIDGWKKYLMAPEEPDNTTGLDGWSVEMTFTSGRITKGIWKWCPDLDPKKRHLEEFNALLQWIETTTGISPRHLFIAKS